MNINNFFKANQPINFLVIGLIILASLLGIFIADAPIVLANSNEITTISVTDLTPDTVIAGQLKVPLMDFTVKSNDSSEKLKQVKVQYAGTNKSDIGILYLYRESEINGGTFNSDTDIQMASDNSSSGDGEFNLNPTNFNMSQNTNYQFYVVADIASGATVGNTVDIKIEKNKITFKSGNWPDTTDESLFNPAGNSLINVATGSIIIVKDTIPDDSQDFNFTTTGTGLSSFSLDDDTDPTLSNIKTFTNLSTGSYAVTESLSMGFDLTNLTCVDPTSNSSGNIETRVATINVAADETVICTFTNTKQATLTINKLIFPADDTGKFNLQIDGSTAGTGADVGDNGTTGAVVVSNEIQHTVGETAGTATNLSDYISVIDGDCDSEGHITLSPGDNKTCNITNTRKATIIVKKVMIGGTDTFDFLGTPAGSIFSNNETITSNIVAGQYVSTETVTPGWDLTSVECDNNDSIGSVQDQNATFNVTAGETVICTFTNTKRGDITVTKLAEGEILGPFTFTLSNDPFVQSLVAIFNSTFPNLTNSWTFENLLPNYTYNLFEEIPLDWAGDQQKSCDQGQNPDSIFLNPGEHITCIFNNTQFGVISGRKFNDSNGNGNDDGATDSGIHGWIIKLFRFDSEVWNQIGDPQTTDPNGSYLFDNTYQLLPGNYRVCEELQSEWYQTRPNTEDSCYTLELSAGQIANDNDFGNFENATLSGYKWDDQNGDGIWQKDSEDSEQALEEWEIKATKDEDIRTTETDENGYYEFTFGVGDVGEWTISETIPSPDWIQRFPYDPSLYIFTVMSGANAQDKNFGNQQDVTPPQSSFENSPALDHKILNIEGASLDFAGSSKDDISNVTSVELSIKKIGDEDSISDYPSQSFFDVFNTIQCSSAPRPIATELVALSLTSADPVTVSWNHSWTTSSTGIYCFEVSATDTTGKIEHTAYAGPVAYIPAPQISEEANNGASETSLTITWTTDHLATSRVIYDTVPHTTLGNAPNYGYTFSTAEINTDPKVTSHSVTITGLTAGTTYYYRSISHGSPENVGNERSVTTLTPPPPSTSNNGSGELSLTEEPLAIPSGNGGLSNLSVDPPIPPTIIPPVVTIAPDTNTGNVIITEVSPKIYQQPFTENIIIAKISPKIYQQSFVETVEKEQGIKSEITTNKESNILQPQQTIIDKSVAADQSSQKNPSLFAAISNVITFGTGSFIVGLVVFLMLFGGGAFLVRNKWFK